MPFFDIVDDVAKHQIDKTDMGDNRIMGVLVCTVVKNYDKDHQGFVQVNITTRDYQESRLVWARMALNYGGQKWGEYFIPEVGDQVLVVFERNGNLVEIMDNGEGEGDNDHIIIKTAKDLHKFEIDNEKKKILISDKEGNNKIEMKTEDGQMEIVAKQKLTIKVGDNIKMIMNGSNGTVTIESTKVKIDTTDTTEVKSNSRINVEGGNVTVSGNSMLKIKSSGPVTVEGTPIKLG